MALTLRVLSHLLAYPDTAQRAHLPEMREALHGENALGASRLSELDALIDHLLSVPSLEAEADYVELFDRGRGTALHLFEHVHGDSRDRGPAMIDLIKTYEHAGLLLGPGELPDHLTVALEYASTQPAMPARDFLREFAHILQLILTALVKRQSRYASAIAALLELAGEKTRPVIKLPAEAQIDEAWEEPAAFGGCSSRAPAQAEEPRPILIVRTPAIHKSPPGASA